VRDLALAGERLAACGMTNPALAPWRSAAAPALARTGWSEKARQLVAVEVAAARDWGAPLPLARALRAAAALEPRPDQALAAGEEAVTLLTTAGAAELLGPAMFELGTLAGVARRADQARDAFRRSCQLAADTGDAELGRRARTELAAAGGRFRPARAGLTDTEHRVTALAAAGHRNREIAALLFVGQRTVEIHLTNAYRKLGITGRDQLGAALAPAATAG
jgi:DNA-binding CsgD family transcriptional regulator